MPRITTSFSHSRHVAEYAGILAEEYGMSEDFIELVREAGLPRYWKDWDSGTYSEQTGEAGAGGV